MVVRAMPCTVSALTKRTQSTAMGSARPEFMRNLWCAA